MLAGHALEIPIGRPDHLLSKQAGVVEAMTARAFLADLVSIPWSIDAKHGFRAAVLFIGKGANALEVAVAHSAHRPNRTSLLGCWRARRGKRAAPVLTVVLHEGGAALCGASGGEPPVYTDMDAGLVERLCREALDQPDRHAALRFLSQALPSLETALPGLNNEGLLALHELQSGVPARADWEAARPKAAATLGKRDDELLSALGFRIEQIDNLTYLLRGGDRRTALAVMLREGESPEAGNNRFNSLSPVSYALKKADDENLPWVLLTQGNRLRLYATATDAGVGRSRPHRDLCRMPAVPAGGRAASLSLVALFCRRSGTEREVCTRFSRTRAASPAIWRSASESASTTTSCRRWPRASPRRGVLTDLRPTNWRRPMRWR